MASGGQIEGHKGKPRLSFSWMIEPNNMLMPL
jgi:hypothetical protein